MKEILILLINLVLTSFSFSQSFIPYVNNPVIDTLLTDDPSEVWTRWKSDPYLIHWNSDSLRIYYGTNNYGSNTQIGTAVSHDGITWVENRVSPVIYSGSAGTWDASEVETPGVIYVPTNPDSMKYLLYYSGATSREDLIGVILEGVYPEEVFQIGLAYSANGIDFTKYNDPSNDINPLYAHSDPVFSIPEALGGIPSEVNVYYATIAEPSPIFDAELGLFRMWFIGAGCDNPTCEGVENFRYRVLYAESIDGINWGDYSVVLDIGDVTDFDSKTVYAPHVIKLDSEYWMFYGGNNVSVDSFSLFSQKIGLARSMDGISFEKSMYNPIIIDGPLGSWNDFGVNFPAGIVFHDTLRVYYSAVEDPVTNFRPNIGYTSLDSSLAGLFENYKDDSALLMFPNPSKGEAIIQSTNALIEKITLFNLEGKLLQEMNGIHSYSHQIVIAGYDSGIYIVTVTLDNGQRHQLRIVHIQ